jgi:heme-degrading monooxygenase HmoA
VSFRYDEGFESEKVKEIAAKAQGKFQGMPGLRSKAFMLSAPRREATNFYVWDSEAAAQAFFTEELRAAVTELYGVAPIIEFVEIAELVQN